MKKTNNAEIYPPTAITVVPNSYQNQTAKGKAEGQEESRHGTELAKAVASGILKGQSLDGHRN